MLKWAKGSKHGGHHNSGHPSSTRVSLADLRRASAKLLRRKESSSLKSNKNCHQESDVMSSTTDSPPPPLIPPRRSSNPPTPSCVHAAGVIKQATVRRMSTLQSQATSSSSSKSGSCCSSNLAKMRRKKPNDTSDNASSLYMQLDKIPVAVQQSTHLNQRKALEDISNQAYRHIIHSLQDELAQMSDSADESQTQLSIHQLESTWRNHSRRESVVGETSQTGKDVETVRPQLDRVASFTNQPPASGDLYRPRAVRHPSPKLDSRLVDLTIGLPTSPAIKKTGQHTSTGQHLHPYCAARSLIDVGSASPALNRCKKSMKQVTFETEARLIGESATLPVVFESNREDSVSFYPSVPSSTTVNESLMPGFVNVPCSRRGFCLDSTDQVDGCPVKRVTTSPDGNDWQPSYVNLEDTEIAPVLLASSRPADDSSDFWKPKSVASVQQLQKQIYDAAAADAAACSNSKADDNPLSVEFPGFRYAIQLPGNVLLERRSISNGSSTSDTQDSGVAEMAQAFASSRAASSQSLVEDMLVPAQPFVYNTLPRSSDNKRSQYHNGQPTPTQQQTSGIYSTTDPHFLSALASPFFSRRIPQSSHSPLSSASSSAALMANIDGHDSSWSSDHLYCNMASVDPLPSLPPRISRRCHSLLTLVETGADTTRAISENADYENLNMSSQPGQPAMAFKARLNVSHSRSRSLRHSGDFTSPFKVKESDRKTGQDGRPVSARRQQLLNERANRLELMLNDASVNDCSEMYEPSDWSMEAVLSDTVRDMDNLSLLDDERHCHNCQHCCCTPARRPAQCRCQMVIVNPSVPVCRCRKSLSRTASAADNPLYMAYNDLTQIDELDRSAKRNSPILADDYASDGCETWNSHKALYARLQAAKLREISQDTLTRKRPSRHHNKTTLKSSGSRIWRHDGQSVSTPQKNRRESGRRRQSRRRSNSANTTANSSKLNRTAVSTRSIYSTRASIRRRQSSKRSKTADVLHGKGQLQLAIYLNSGLLTIHVQSARYLKSNNGKFCNSYVKVSLIPDSPEQTFCRTTLIKNDNNPWYDQKFSFEFLSADLYKRLFISVWDRDPKKNRSDFMGCMSFSVSHVIRKDANGWYRLLNGNIGRQRHFAVKKQIDLNNSTIVPIDPHMEEDLVVVDDSDVDNETDGCLTRRNPSRPSAEIPITESDLASHVGPAEVKGKTPYTMTMNLKRGPKGYGFSVTWTHPPRIERVEPGLAADLAGMRVADYIIFVGRQNVVKMNEDQVLHLIQSAGDHLTLEIYRKNGKPFGSVSSVKQQQSTDTEFHSSRADYPLGTATRSQIRRCHLSKTQTAKVNNINTKPAKCVRNDGHPDQRVTERTSCANLISNCFTKHANVRNLDNTPLTVSHGDLLERNLSNAPLKVAFNESIGGGVFV